MATVLTTRRSLTAEMVTTALRERILREGLAPGDRLPGYWDLARDLGVAYVTVKRGVDELVASGQVRRVHGKGLFVAARPNPKPRELHRILAVFPSSMNFVFTSVYLTDLARGALSAMAPKGFGVVRSMMDEGIIFGDYVDRLNPDAVVLMGVENDDYLRMAANWHQPVVAADYYSESVPINFVACDNRRAARHCVEHLAKLGHRRIGYVGGEESFTLILREDKKESLVQRSSDERERREGVLEAAAACGLPAPCVIGNAGQAQPLEESLARCFGRADRPTALVLNSNLTAPDIIRWLAGKGLGVPGDVSLCAVAGSGGLADYPGLTFCRFDFAAMGRKAVEVLRERLANPGPSMNRIHRIGFEWVEGKSTRGAVIGNQ